jgi:hypothetical protein
VPRLTFLLVVSLCLLASSCATTDTGGSDSAGAIAQGDGSIEVPDVSAEDGADAVSDVESESLTTTLADDGDDDSSFDSSRDASGCTVTEQDPAAGEMVDEGTEVAIIVDCRQVDWENQEGTDWEAFGDAYLRAFDDACIALFAGSPNGSFYEDDVEYATIDCQNESPGDGSEATDIPGDVPDEPEGAGTDAGELDGCQALFENQGITSLNYGQESITESDCPVTS